VGAFSIGGSDARWTVEQGPQSARIELARCATSAETEPCVRVVYSLCEREHGSSTHAMTDCMVYVGRAAEARMSDAESHVRRWLELHPKDAKSALARQTVMTPRAWKLRAVQACEHSTAASKDGALYQFLLHRCLAGRYAARTLELEAIVKPR
jgi:uncharacterized protein YecT (DUF1311 family)